jgi:hypothetical protein
MAGVTKGNVHYIADAIGDVLKKKKESKTKCLLGVIICSNSTSYTVLYL